MDNYFIKNDLNEVVKYTENELTQEVKCIINSAYERGYNISTINSLFILQDLTGLLNKKDFIDSNNIHKFIDNLLKRMELLYD